MKNREKKGPPRGIIQSANLWIEFRGIQNLKNEHIMKPLNRSDVGAQTPGNWQRLFINSAKEIKDTFRTPAEAE